MPDNTDIKVQIEGLKKDIENVNSIQCRLDTAIDKLTDLSTCVKSMLAVHEEKISRQEQLDDVIFDKLKETSRTRSRICSTSRLLFFLSVFSNKPLVKSVCEAKLNAASFNLVFSASDSF